MIPSPKKKKPPCPDLNLFAVDDCERPARDGDSLPYPRPGELYLGVRMPMPWVERAVVLPGRAWQLACALWFEVVCQKKKCATVSLPLNTRRRFGLSCRQTFYRALAALQGAGLVHVESPPGRRLKIAVTAPNEGKGRGERPCSTRSTKVDARRSS
jgi:hypothetical protein